jgi:cytochrome c2
MMKQFGVILALCVLIACSKKSLPTIERRTEEPKAPVIEIDMAYGERVFNNACKRCHDLPKPSKYSAERWEPVLSIMIPRARLSGVEAANVRAYVKANSATQ